MQITGGLVGQNQFRTGDHRARNGDQLLLSTGQLIGVQVFLTDNVKPVQNVADQAGAFRRLDVPVGKGDVQILVNGKIINQMVALKNEPNIFLVNLHALLGVQFVDRLLGKVEFTSPGAVQHAQYAE